MILRVIRMLGACLIAVLACTAPTRADEEAAWSALKAGAVVLFRHANAPGTGDPVNFSITDCSTQRNLDDTGRAQAKRIGETFRARGVVAGKVLTSQWCRSRDTATLAFPGLVTEEAAFNSFFQDRTTEHAQTETARQIIREWDGPAALVIVTHQVNMTALSGIVPDQGEGIVLSVRDSEIQVVGRITP
jgi:phosphohistidine phosphatase SixA